MKTGIVIEILRKKAIVMDSAGSFVMLPAGKGWEVGDVVRLRKNSVLPRTLATLAACFALVTALGVGGRAIYFTQAALISIDVNPSIELTLNRFNRVIASRARNPEAQQILARINVEGQTYSNAVARILGEENQEGYLAKNASVVVTVYAKDAVRQDEILGSITTLTDTALAVCQVSIEAEYYAVGTEMVESAHTHNMTAGKYLFVEQLSEIHPQTDVGTYSHHSIDQIRGEIKACRDGHAMHQSGSRNDNTEVEMDAPVVPKHGHKWHKRRH